MCEVLLVDLRGLGEPGLLLVHGLRDEDARSSGPRSRSSGEQSFIIRMNCSYPDPRGVEEDVVAEVTDAVDDLAGVVDRAVVGAELDDGEAERTLRVGALGSTSRMRPRR